MSDLVRRDRMQPVDARRAPSFRAVGARPTRHSGGAGEN